MKPTFDPIKFEVIRNALIEATEEMTIALRRSAYSTNIKTRADFSCAFFDKELQPVAQSFTQPVHLGSLSQSVPRVIREYGPQNLGPGDAILSNDPYLGGVHLNDITLISPVYYNDELFGYVANLAHHVDVGGGAPASIGAFREVFQEGVIISAVKMVEGGEINPDVFRLVLAQIRSKHETAGDFRAQVASNNTGVRRLTALLDRMGAETINFYIDQLLAYTERRTRAEIAKLPQGIFTADGYVDNDGYTDEPVHLVGKLVINDDGILFDLNGSETATSGTRQLHVCPDLLRLRLCPEKPDRSGYTGQRGFLPFGSDRCTVRDGGQLHTAVSCGRGLGDADTAERCPAEGARTRHPRQHSGGDEGDDVPDGVRWHLPAHRGTVRLLRDDGWRLRRTGCQRRTRCRAMSRAEHRERSH